MSKELIDRLVLDLQPVERLHSPGRRFMEFGALALAVAAATVWFVGPRADLAVKLRDGAYLAETALLLVLFTGATIAALRSAVPGATLGSPARLIMISVCGWLLLVAACHRTDFAGAGLSSGLSCLCRTALLGALPAWWLLAMLRRSAPLEPGVSGALTMVAAGALAVSGTRFLCAKDGVTHVLLWHAAPLALFALLGWCLGRAWLAGSVSSTFVQAKSNRSARAP